MLFFKAVLKNYWPMSDLNDVVGGANLYGGSSYSFTYNRFCSPNSAIYFNNGYLQVPPGLYFTGDFSVVIWIYVLSFVSNTRIIDFSNGNYTNGVALSMAGGSFVIKAGIYNSPSDYTILANWITTPSIIQLNQWYHVVFTLTGITGSIYVNGIQQCTGTLIAPSYISRQYNYIGNANPAQSYPNAIYDDLKIYENSLTSAQVLNDYTISSANGKTYTLNYCPRKSYFIFMLFLCKFGLFLLFLSVNYYKYHKY